MERKYTMELYGLEPVQFANVVKVCIAECENVLDNIEDKNSVPTRVALVHKYLGKLLARLEDVIDNN